MNSSSERGNRPISHSSRKILGAILIVLVVSDCASADRASIARAQWTTDDVEEIKTALAVNDPLPERVQRDYIISESGDRTDTALVLDGIHFVGLRIEGFDFSNCSLPFVTFAACTLLNVDFTNAKLFRADFSNSVLGASNFKHADLRGANLTNADLFSAIFDSTYLFQANLDKAKNVEFVVWGDVQEPRYVIGEECVGDTSSTSDIHYAHADLMYAFLKSIYQDRLHLSHAEGFHFRLNRIRTKSAFPLIRWLRKGLLELSYGYGSHPWWLFYYSLTIVLIWAGIYVLLSLSENSCIRIVPDIGYSYPIERGWTLIRRCLFFSFLTFVTLGFGILKMHHWIQYLQLRPVNYKPTGWSRLFVAVEIALGIWVFALVTVVLFGGSGSLS